jgi:hypothetical protein
LDKKHWDCDVVTQQSYKQTGRRTTAIASPLQPADKPDGNQREPGYTTNDERHPRTQWRAKQQLNNGGRGKQQADTGHKLCYCDRCQECFRLHRTNYNSVGIRRAVQAPNPGGLNVCLEKFLRGSTDKSSYTA